MSLERPPTSGGGGRRRGLGMGLSALLGGDDAGAGGWRDNAAETVAPVGTSRLMPIEFLQPSSLQPRRRFDDDALAELAELIRAKGVLQPLVVRRLPRGEEAYEIVAGERRWRAAQLAGRHELPVVIHELSDREALEVALLENIQRRDLTPLEEAEGYRRLIDEFGHTQEELAGTVGKSRSHIANLMRLLGLPPELRTMIEAGTLSSGHARALLGAADPVALARQVVDRGLNVRQTEALVRADAQPTRATAPSRPRAAGDVNTAALERDLSLQLGLTVALKPKGSGGTLSITYLSLEQLDGLLQRIRHRGA